MKKQIAFFGLTAILKNYGWKSFRKDCICPILLSLCLIFTLFFKRVDHHSIFLHLIQIGISILPAMIAILLTSYTIMLSIFSNGIFTHIKCSENGKKLITSLNSNFAVCLLVSTLTLLIMIFISVIDNMYIELLRSTCILLISFFLISFLLFFSVSTLFGVIIDLFNIGQTHLLYNSKDNTISDDKPSNESTSKASIGEVNN